MVKKYFIFLNHIHSLQKQLNLHYIKIMAFQLLFLFSFVLESAVFHGDEVSSLNKLEGVFAQRHSFMKATYCLKY